MKKYTIQTKDNETFKVSLDDIKMGDVEAEVRKLLRRRAVGDCIYVARLRAGLTQQQLGEKAKVAQCNITKLERGYYNASIDVLTRIATALDCELTLKKC